MFLRVERTLGAARYTPREVAELTGIEPEEGLRYRQALGLPRPDLDERVLTDRDVEALTQLKAFEAAGLPEEGLVEMARVLGESLSRVAAAVRVLVRDALLDPHVGERELSARFAAINEQLGPQLGEDHAADLRDAPAGPAAQRRDRPRRDRARAHRRARRR